MGPFRDLRTFLDALQGAGEIYQIDREVDPDRELGAVLHAAELAGKAALFNKVKGYSQPVVGGVLGSRSRIALALGCPQSSIDERVAEAIAHPVAPREGTPSFEEHVEDGQVDLTALPVPVHAPGDAGPFINAGVVIARDPEGGRHNLTYVRLQVFGPNRVGLNINPRFRHMRDFLDVADARGEPLPFCVAIGLEPAVMMAAAFRYPGDEYELAGGLVRSPVEVVRARTCDIAVPASSEIVLECTTEGLETDLEGPMAEFTGHYSGQRPQRVARVVGISQRRQPIFQTIAGASAEHLLLGAVLSHEPAVRRAARAVSASVRDVVMPSFGHGFSAFISLAPSRPGEARAVGLAALGAHANLKVVAVFDTDIDVHNTRDVIWALSTRARWDEDVLVLPKLVGNSLDPVADADSLVSKVVIDATLSGTARERFVRVAYPAVDLAAYLGTQGS